MKRKIRLAVLLTAFAAAAWLAWAPIPGERANPEPGAAIFAGKPAPDRARFAELPVRAGLGEATGNPFGASFLAPTPKPSAPQAAAVPEPPPLPYKYAGTIEQEGVAQHLLVKDERVYPVVQGGALDGGYRIESASASEIVLMYLPLNVRQSIPMPSGIRHGDGAERRPGSPVAAAGSPTVGSAGSTPSAPARDAGGSSASVNPARGAAARLRWDGPSEVRAGASFEVALRVTSGEALVGSPMQLRYDSAMLEPVAVRPGRFFSAGRNFSYRAGADGSIFVGVSGAGGPAADAELLVLTFKPIRADATAELRIASLDLQGPSGRALAFDAPQAYRTVVLR